MASRRTSPRAGRRPQYARDRTRRLLRAAIAVAIIGEGGHQLLDRYGTALGHHAFHVATVGAASLLFAAIVVADIRANGRPRFSWRLSTARERTSGR